MATKKISELEAVTTAEDNDVLVLVDVSEGTTNKITKGNLLLSSGNQIEIDSNSETYQLVFKLKNSVGTVLSTATIDLPSENAITKIEYDQGELKITKQSGSIETVDISGLIEGLVTESDFNTFTQALAETIGAINEKDAEQDEAIAENYKVINKLKSKVANQQKVIDQLPQVTGQGTEVTLEDTIEAPFTKFDVEGHSEQETTEGYNLAEIIREPITSNGVTFTPLEDGGLKIQGTTTAGGNYRILTSANIPVVQGGKTYTRVAKVVGTLNKNDKYVLISGRNNSSQDIMGDMSIAQDTTTYKTSSITNDETMSNIMIYCSGSGVVFNCILYFMLVEGTYSSSNPIDFEKYTNGASPSPNWEQPIKSCGDDINEFDKDNANVINGYIGTANKIVPYASNQLIYFSVTPLKTYTLKKYIGNSNIWIATSENEPQITSVVNNLVKPEKKEYTITMPENQNYLIIQVRLDVDATEGYTLKDILNGIKIVEGTYIGKYTPYSPYGMGSITEKIVNENYLSLSEATVGTAGVIANISETKMKFSGKMVLVTNIFNTIREDKTIPAGTYKLSYKKLSGATSGSGDWAVYFNFYNANGTKIANKNFASNEIGIVKKDLVLSEDVAYYSYSAYCNSTSLIFNDLELGFMITKDTPTDYIPHKEQTYTIPVQQPMRSIGDVRDVFFKNTVDSPYYDENLTLNGWYERHYINRKIFDGTEQWTIRNNGDGSTTMSFNLNVSNLGSINFRCNKFQPSQGSMDGKEGISIVSELISIYIQIKRERLSSVDVVGFKSWLAQKYANGKPVYIDYILATPLDLPCTEEQIEILENPPKTHAGQTNIYSEDEVKAYLEVSGIYDLNKLITRTEVLESEV